MLIDKILLELDNANNCSIIYFEKILHESIAHFKQITNSILPINYLYSTKANTHPFLLKAMYTAGIHCFDASSPAEANLIYKIFGKNVFIFLTYPGFRESDLKIIPSLGNVCVHLDSIPSLHSFLKKAKDIPFGLRINPGISTSRNDLYNPAGKRSRLGISLNELELAVKLCKKYGRTEFGLHFHISFLTKDFNIHSIAIKRISKKLDALENCFKITHFDLGGGISPPGWDFKKDRLIPANLDKQSIKQLSDECKNFFYKHQHKLGEYFSFMLEPGDFFVNACGIMITNVIETRKDGRGKEYAILDTNLSQFPNLVTYGQKPVVFGVKNSKQSKQIILAGNSCIGRDILSVVPVTKCPSKIVFEEKGSYEYSQFNFFNGRLRPTIYFYDRNDNLIKIKEDTSTDLVRYWHEDSREYPLNYESFNAFEDIAIMEKNMPLYHPKLRYISSFEIDPEAIPFPKKIVHNFYKNFFNYSNSYGRSIGLVELRKKITEYENKVNHGKKFYDETNCITTIGATNAIYLAQRALFEKTLHRTLICCPGYYQYTQSAQVLGIPWTHIHKQKPRPKITNNIIESESILPNEKDIIEKVNSNPDMKSLVLANPGLPHGVYLPMQTIRCLTNLAKKQGWGLIVDETLGDLTYSYAPKIDWSWLSHSDPVIRVKSFSKTFGFSGVRFGYMVFSDYFKTFKIGNEKFVDRIRKYADAIYGTPPAFIAPLVFSCLDALEKHALNEKDNEKKSKNDFLKKNIQKLEKQVGYTSKVLLEYNISHIIPEAGPNVLIALEKLAPYPNKNFDFFRKLIKAESMFVELGGLFAQNPEYDFTIARLGLGRNRKVFKKDLRDFCEFYNKY